MKLSTRFRYGARATAELASPYPDRPVSIREMADRQKISPKYLAKIMHALSRAGLAKAVRGMHGGYVLARPPQEITLGELFEALEGTLAPVDCVDHPDSCPLEAACPTRETWMAVRDSMARVLSGTTVQDLVERKRHKGALSAPMYHI